MVIHLSCGLAAQSLSLLGSSIASRPSLHVPRRRRSPVTGVAGQAGAGSKWRGRNVHVQVLQPWMQIEWFWSLYIRDLLERTFSSWFSNVEWTHAHDKNILVYFCTCIEESRFKCWASSPVLSLANMQCHLWEKLKKTGSLANTLP
jgi:hypothetical protein